MERLSQRPLEEQLKKKARTHWIQVFPEDTWREFLDSGGGVTGFREKRWTVIQNIKVGDLLLCYVSRISCWVGILEVESQPYLDDKRIWKGELYPCRVDVKVLASLTPEQGVPIRRLRNRLTIFESRSWGMHFYASPSRFNLKDASVMHKEIMRSTSPRLVDAPHQS